MFAPFTTTGIGSLPHRDPEEACRLVLETCDIPFWPQLPNITFHESMIPQFSEGLPLIRIDEEREVIWAGKNGAEELMRFYETYSEEWRVPVSEDYAKGLYTFIKLIRNRRFPYLKGQVTGPLTFTLGLKDSEGRPVYFDEELREISLMLLKAKIRWQLEFLKPYAEKIVLFIDEPILSALGSTSYISVETREVQRLLEETVDAIKRAGGISGIHCCGNADWSSVIKSGTEMISFDAYGYGETISLYPVEFTAFLEDGGYLAWGVIPTGESIKEESEDSIKKRFYEVLENVSKKISKNLLLSQILLTPSCGAGSMTIEEALKVFRLLKNLKKAVA